MVSELKMNRRSFLTGAVATGALAAMGLTGCSPQKSEEPAGAAASAEPASEPPVHGAPTWLGEAPAITDADCTTTVDTEVLVVGAGCSGLFAANFAAKEGAQTLLIERYQKGAGVRGSAIGAINSRKQKEAGVEINVNDIINDLSRYSLNQGNIELYRLWAENSAEAVDWYCDLVEGVDNVQVDLEYNMPTESCRYAAWPTGHGSMIPNEKLGKDARGAESVTYRVLVDNFEGMSNATLMYQTGLECLIKEGDRIVGVYASDADGNHLRINASKGVIVATGGYSCNPEMYLNLQGELAKSLTGIVPFADFNAQGQGIKACMWAGAAKDGHTCSMVFDRGAMKPDQVIGAPYDMVFDYFHMATQPFLKVDNTGARISNESSPYDFLVHAAANRGDRSWYPIWDANWAEDVHRFHTVGCSTLELREGGNQMDPEGLDGTAGIIESFIENGYIIKADTLEDLAQGLGFDRDVFLATVDKYNALYDAQEDTEFGKEAFRLSEIRTAPFYGIKIGGLALCTLDGIKINTQFQALDDANVPIEGLYVIGNDSGSYYGSTYPNLGAGTNAGRCVTFGMLCGRQVANL